jgi:hypothetical protein
VKQIQIEAFYMLKCGFSQDLVPTLSHGELKAKSLFRPKCLRLACIVGVHTLCYFNPSTCSVFSNQIVEQVQNAHSKT